MSQQYSMVEVAANNGADGKPTWIVIRDIVYDVTNYMEDVSIPVIGELLTFKIIQYHASQL